MFPHQLWPVPIEETLTLNQNPRVGSGHQRSPTAGIRGPKTLTLNLTSRCSTIDARPGRGIRGSELTEALYMWWMVKTTKEGGIDVIETYVFGMAMNFLRAIIMEVHPHFYHFYYCFNNNIFFECLSLTPLNLPALFSFSSFTIVDSSRFLFSDRGFNTLHLPNSAVPFQMSEMPPLRNIYLSFATNSTVLRLSPALTLHPHLGTHPALQTARCYTHFLFLSYPLHFSLSTHFSDGSSRSSVGGTGGAVTCLLAVGRGWGVGSVCELGGGGLQGPKEGRGGCYGVCGGGKKGRSRGRVVGGRTVMKVLGTH
ncbi:hypothetical protein AAG906_001779 [Vitis piasezkii]